MADDKKKKGFFGRLFGGEAAPDQEVQKDLQQEPSETIENEVPTSPFDDQASEDVVLVNQDDDVDLPDDLDPDTHMVGAPNAPAAPEDQPELPPLSESSEAPKKSWLSKLTSGLSRSSNQLTSGITGLFTKAKLDAETLDDFEDLLIQADLGVETSLKITEALSKAKFDKGLSAEGVQAILAEEVEKVLAPVATPLEMSSETKPYVILMIGVNGAGKTTTIGKLAAKFRADGKSVMLAAGDTFRAAAIGQLKVWAERTGAKFIAKEQGGDAGALAFDALEAAKKENVDILIIDTAGRLQNRTELMAELEKVIRVIKRQMPDAPHATLLVLDATTGQNALNQVEIFGKTAGVSGLVMTKLDGTARGGILVAIAAKFGLPVHYLGVGEGVDDLQPFKAKDFAAAIAGLAKSDT